MIQKYLVLSQLKRYCSKLCLKAVSMVNKVLGRIKRTFSIRDKEVILQLYQSLARPHLEYSRPYRYSGMEASLSKRY